jgi:hypothetical protein
MTQFWQIPRHRTLSYPVDMFSAYLYAPFYGVSLLIVALLSSEVPEGLMDYSVLTAKTSIY